MIALLPYSPDVRHAVALRVDLSGTTCSCRGSSIANRIRFYAGIRLAEMSLEGFNK